jgi:hypothetical protein
MSAHPLTEGKPHTRDPYVGNQAIPTLLVTRDRELFHHLCPELRLVRVEWFSFVAYPMSGGFKPWSLLTASAASQMLRFERLIEPFLGQLMAFRMMITIEKDVVSQHLLHPLALAVPLIKMSSRPFSRL